MVSKVKKQPAVQSVKNDAVESVSNLPLDVKQVEEGISALLELSEIQHKASKKKSLFNDDPQPVLLQIMAIKIPKTEKHQVRITLPHTLIGETADVCLITKDVKFATKNDPERSLLHYQKFLEEKKVEGITQVIPRQQMINEYKPHEAKGRFATLFDAYLVDGELHGLMSNIVGARFFRRNKHLIPVDMQSKDLCSKVKRALSKTVLTVHGNGDTFTLKVADTSFTPQQIQENVLAVIKELSAGKFPGGFPNIRSLHVKTERSLAIPIYLTLVYSDTVDIPVVQPALPRAHQPMTGELSTYLRKSVTVYPDGNVVLDGNEDDDEDEDDDDEDDEDEDEDEEMDTAEPLPARKRKISENEESDDDVEAAEDAYLAEKLLNQPAAKKKKTSPKNTATIEKDPVTVKAANKKNASKKAPLQTSATVEAPKRNKASKKAPLKTSATVEAPKAVKAPKQNKASKKAPLQTSATVVDAPKAVEVPKMNKTSKKAPLKSPATVVTAPKAVEAPKMNKTSKKAPLKSPATVVDAPKAVTMPTNKRAVKSAQLKTPLSIDEVPKAVQAPNNASLNTCTTVTTPAKEKASKKAVLKSKNAEFNHKKQLKMESKKLARKQKLNEDKKAKKQSRASLENNLLKSVMTAMAVDKEAAVVESQPKVDESSLMIQKLLTEAKMTVKALKTKSVKREQNASKESEKSKKRHRSKIEV